uniref:Fatty acyl-CoA reductase n=1 Tax=Anopheles culicifacies TaxID=139723 RepID=A0A182MN06_9DIPT
MNTETIDTGPMGEGALNVAEFYRNATVLVTGGTGFIGKVLVEKLLRCFEVKKIFLLIRRKENASATDRLQRMLEGPMFDRIRSTAPDAKECFAKVVAIDTSFEREDIVDDVDKAKLCNEVQIVFHVMASVRFDEVLDDAIALNVTSAKRLYALASSMAELRSIVHVSTFYSNCNRKYIEERIYDDVPYGGLDHIQHFFKGLNPEEKKRMTRLVVGDMPNTYVFSKKCAEAMIGREFNKLPIGIFRPPIVISSYREPEPGWVDCFHGATGLCVPAVLGKTMWYYGNPSVKPFMSPVDHTVSGMLATACDIHRRQCTILPVDKPVPVYNFTFEKNRFTFGEYVELVCSGLRNPLDRWLSRIKCRISPWKIFPRILLWLTMIQARAVDEVLAWFGKRGRNQKIVSAINSLANAVEYFRLRTWTMDNSNVKRMLTLLSRDDAQRLDFDGERIDWRDYYKTYAKGIATELVRQNHRRQQYRKSAMAKQAAQSLNDTGKMKILPVSQFYRDAVVLVTGGTGFLGKVLVEKLLRSFEVKKIFLLIREKRGVSPTQRLQQMISDPIFDTIRGSLKHHETVLQKLVAIETDFTSQELVKEPYKSDILNETQIVFHSMASVRFNLGFQNIMDTNVTGTERLYNFLRDASRLQAIVHVSTFYSNSDRSHIDECVYDDIRFGGWDNIRRIIEPLTESERNKLMPAMIAPLPNNYTFSKKCAEVMIQQQFSQLPIGIFRPPIVTPSSKEPSPGWVDCIQGVTGLCIPILKHKLLWYYGEPNALPALAPVDYCIAGMITAACDIKERHEANRVLQSFDRHVSTPPVYNFYFDKNPISWHQFLDLVGAGLPTLMGRKLRSLRTRLTRWRILSTITFWWMYFIAYIGDMFLALFRKRKSHVRNVSGLNTLADATELFRCHTWTASNNNVKRLISSLSKGDEALLEFNVDLIDWEDYLKQFTMGLSVELERQEQRKQQKKKPDASALV